MVGTALGALQGPPRWYTKDAEAGERAEGAVDYVTQCDRENKHSVKASASVSSHSYDRSESGVRVDGPNDTNDWNVRDGGACRRTDCDQTEGRTGSRSTLHC